MPNRTGAVRKRTAFSKLQPDTDVVVESGGSLSALIALKRGSVDVAAMDRDLKASEEEAGLKSYLVARNGVGIVVHPDCRLLSLQATQVRALLAGEVRNWAQVGGPHAAVQVVSRTRGSTGTASSSVRVGGRLAGHPHMRGDCGIALMKSQ